MALFLRGLLEHKKLPLVLGMGIALALIAGYTGLAFAGKAPLLQAAGGGSSPAVHSGQMTGGHTVSAPISSSRPGLTPQQKQQAENAVTAQGMRGAPVGPIAPVTNQTVGNLGSSVQPPTNNNGGFGPH